MLRGASWLGQSLLITFTATLASPTLAQVPAPSATPDLSLEWIAPAECPTSADVLSEMLRLFGGREPPRSGERRAVRAVVSHDGPWSVSIETSTESGLYRRTLNAQTCRGLADATALILALSVDPEAVKAAAPPADTSLPPQAPTTTTSVPPPPSVPVAHVPDSGGSLRYSVAIPVSVAAGILPAVDPGIGVALGARLGVVLVDLSVHDWLPVVAKVPGTNAGGTFGLVSGTLYACTAFRMAPFEIGPCAQFDIGSIEATGSGVTTTSTGRALWLAAGPGALGVLTLGAGSHWAIPLHLDLLVPLERRDFVIQHVSGVVFQPPPAAGRATIELEYRF
jgi:hypothetical protein